MAALLRGAIKLAGRVAPQIGKIGGKVGQVVGRVGSAVRRIPGAGAVGTGVAIGAGTIAAERIAGGGGSGDIFGLPLVVEPFAVEALRAPRGYVLVQNPESDDPNDKIAVLKEVAYALKLRKRPTRGGISAHEVRAARKVQRFVTSLTVNRQPRVRLKKGKR